MTIKLRKVNLNPVIYYFTDFFLLGSTNILKLLVKLKKNLSMTGKIDLRTRSICIPLASIFT